MSQRRPPLRQSEPRKRPISRAPEALALVLTLVACGGGVSRPGGDSDSDGGASTGSGTGSGTGATGSGTTGSGSGSGSGAAPSTGGAVTGAGGAVWGTGGFGEGGTAAIGGNWGTAGFAGTVGIAGAGGAVGGSGVGGSSGTAGSGGFGGAGGASCSNTCFASDTPEYVDCINDPVCLGCFNSYISGCDGSYAFQALDAYICNNCTFENSCRPCFLGPTGAGGEPGSD